MASSGQERRRALAYIRGRIRRGKVKKANLLRWAEELCIAVPGTGADGAVTKEDLIRAFEG